MRFSMYRILLLIATFADTNVHKVLDFANFLRKIFDELAFRKTGWYGCSLFRRLYVHRWRLLRLLQIFDTVSHCRSKIWLMYGYKKRTQPLVFAKRSRLHEVEVLRDYAQLNLSNLYALKSCSSHRFARANIANVFHFAKNIWLFFWNNIEYFYMHFVCIVKIFITVAPCL